ncbi:MAG: ABC transporter permease [Acidobacteria bacterium]|nr:ABC transporter permease [Acidobacteriota bacterium]
MKYKTALIKFIYPLLGFIIIVIIWFEAINLGLISEKNLPSPASVARGMWELFSDGRLIDYSIASLFRVTVGWYIAVLTAIPIGLILGWNKGLQNITNPLLQFLRPISPLAWIPLALIWFGIGDPPAVFLIFLSSFFPMVVSTVSAVNGINPLYIRAAQNIGYSGPRMMFKVVLPATLPSVIVSLRLSLGIAWLVVVAAEMIAVKSGLGYLIIDARNALRLDWVIDGMIIIGVIGIILDKAIRKLERLKSLKWGHVHAK